jgi:ABC-2 type transport system ATP-binding protein
VSMSERVGPAVLRIVDARCRVGRHRIFSGLDLEVRAGERVHLDGPNGSGKTTVLRCVGGTMCIDRGRIEIGGAAAGSARARALTGLCVDPEQGLYPRLSGHDNLLFAARLRMPAREAGDAVGRVERELAITPFAAQRALDYSAGMRARVTVARALLGRPAVLLLDEPTRSLDADGRELFWAAVDRRSDAAWVIASHLPGDRDRCDRSLDLSQRPR